MMRGAPILLLSVGLIALPLATARGDTQKALNSWGIVDVSDSGGSDRAFDSAPVDDAELAGSYGKFIAPGGIDLAMSVQSETAVNGQLVLRSVFTVDQGPGTLQIYAPAVGAQGPAFQTVGAGAGQAQSAAQGVSVTIDRSGANMSVQPTYGATAPASNIAIGGSAASAAANEGLVRVAPTAGGGGVDTGAGTVSLAATSNGMRVTLDSMGLSVSHLVGDAAGTAVANSVNNRVIDTVTSISIDVRNSNQLAIGSSLLRVDGLATAAAMAMVR
jgi:hypothetical protein